MRMLLLHGLGGNGRIWDHVKTLIADEVIAPDLAGHGAAPWLPAYDFERYAQDLLERYGAQLADGPLRILGHSLGGAVGIVLTSLASELDVRGIATVGVKTHWPEQDVKGMHRVADKGVGWFDSFEAAAERFIKVSGLAGLVTASDPVVLHGVVADGERWRFAADPETFRSSPKLLRDYLGSVHCPVVMAAGAQDAMASPESLAHLGLPVVALDGVGHNAHVQGPEAVVELLAQLK